MPNTDDQLVARLSDRNDPRLPLHFKSLDHQRARGVSFAMQVGTSTWHRTSGYACGVTIGTRKPLSKLFEDVDAG